MLDQLLFSAQCLWRAGYIWKTKLERFIINIHHHCFGSSSLRRLFTLPIWIWVQPTAEWDEMEMHIYSTQWYMLTKQDKNKPTNLKYTLQLSVPQQRNTLEAEAALKALHRIISALEFQGSFSECHSNLLFSEEAVFAPQYHVQSSV